MGLAVVQVGVAVLIGSFLFDMDWGHSLPMVLVILFGWAALCTSLALLLGSVGKSEGQVSGFGDIDSLHSEVHGTVRLVSARDATIYWSYTADVAALGNPDQIAQHIATQIVDALRAQLH